MTVMREAIALVEADLSNGEGLVCAMLAASAAEL